MNTRPPVACDKYFWDRLDGGPSVAGAATACLFQGLGQGMRGTQYDGHPKPRLYGQRPLAHTFSGPGLLKQRLMRIL
jgi:hypothetical protein